MVEGSCCGYGDGDSGGYYGVPILAVCGRDRRLGEAAGRERVLTGLYPGDGGYGGYGW